MKRVDEWIKTCIGNNWYASKGYSELYYIGGRIRLEYKNNVIVKEESNAILISTCGWNTPTTRRKLNIIPGVKVKMVKKVLYLNGKVWDGKEIRISKHKLLEFRGQLPGQRKPAPF